MLEQIRVSEAMSHPRPAFAPDSTIENVIERFASLDLGTLPLVTASGELAGIVSAADLDAAISEGQEPLVLAGLLQNAATIRADESLDAAMKVLAAEEDGVPVLAARSDRLVGWLTHGDLLRSYAAHSGVVGSREGSRRT